MSLRRPGGHTGSTVRAAGTSAGAQLAGKAVHLILNVVSTLAILRYLAPDAYGSFILVVTVTTLLGVVADFGLPKLAVREVARADTDFPRTQNEIIGTVAALRLGLAVVAMVGAQLVLLAVGQPRIVHEATAIATLILLVDAVLGVVVVTFQVQLVQQYEALVRVVAEAVETALVLAMVFAQVSFLWLFVPPVIGLLVGTGLALLLARHRCGLRLRAVRHRARHLIVEALPLGPALLLGVLFLKLDTLVVGAMRPAHDLGIYGSAYQPIEYLFLATAVIMNVLFPLIAAAWGGGETSRFVRLYRRGTELLVILTVFVAVVLAFVAPEVVRLAFGDAYIEAATPMRILAVALVAMTVSAWQSLVLLAGGHQRITLVYNAAALGFALVSCIALVGLVGMTGAAVSALLSSGVVLGASLVAVRRRLGASLDFGRLGLVLLAAAGTALVVAGLSRLGLPWIVLPVAIALLYGVALQRCGFGRSLRQAFE